MSKPIVSLAEGLRELRELLSVHCRATMVLPPRDAQAMQACCDILIARAAALEARCGHGRAAETILQEIERPDSNIALFPIVPRPTPGDTPHGGAG